MDLAIILERNSEHIVEEWVARIRGVTHLYSSRPTSELFLTTSRVRDANFAVLVHDDYSLINHVIKGFSHMRSGAGFLLSDVQKAFALYKQIVAPLLSEKMDHGSFVDALDRIDRCLNYTIYRFSDSYQSLTQKNIRDYAQNLEVEVEKRTEELAQSEAKYRVLVEEISDGYFVNQDGTIVFANRAFCEMHGYTLREVIGRAYTDFVMPASLPEVQEWYRQRMERGESKEQYVYLRRHKERGGLPTENKVKLVTYQGKTAAAGICRDITQRIEMEKRIREAEGLARIGQLTTSLAHEIRNPLSSVKMNIQILLQNLGLRGNDKRRMEIVDREISRLEKILEEMLDFAKPVTLSFSLASFKEVIDSCLEVLDFPIKKKAISVRTSHSRPHAACMMDRDKMGQAIINVLLNSIEVLPENGTIEVRSRTRARGKDDEWVEIEIADDGPGASKADLPYLFDPFFSKKSKGTGLGLVNVKKIVQAHGGVVEAALRKPKGMRVTLRIPKRG
ncbi:MAG: ATP-binding protein [Syntrophorhabdales bacterium]|jgi:PAS domain S-box-containing protein